MSKVLFVSGDLSRGGAQRVLSLLANAFDDRGWESSVAVLLNDEIGYQLNKTVRVHNIVSKKAYLRSLLFWIAALHRLIKKERPDVIVSFVGRVNLIAMAAAIGTRVPVVVSERNDPAHDRRSGFEVLLCKIFYHFADNVVFQTKYQRAYYGECCENNSVIIENPIAAPKYTGTHPSSDIISVGKLMRQKNHSMLINAFSQIADDFPYVNVHIFGEGALREELQEQIDSLGLHDRVRLEGNSKNIFDELQKHKYFVMCSEYEGMSNALLEALVSGMICITTDWNGARDAVNDGENGYVIPLNDPDRLAELLRKLLSGELSEPEPAAEKTAERYDLKTVSGKWIREIEKTVRHA